MNAVRDVSKFLGYIQAGIDLIFPGQNPPRQVFQVGVSFPLFQQLNRIAATSTRAALHDYISLFAERNRWSQEKKWRTYGREETHPTAAGASRGDGGQTPEGLVVQICKSKEDLLLSGDEKNCVTF